ncbi:hypothetical protein PENTCL1PPCAC_8600, partial [Pristionchus entomophagus]
IQSLRGIAICSVLFFHIRPDLFINGFLGVDVFFILSGFLISSILSRHEKLSLGSIIQFYARRFKRIVPLYVTVLMMSLMGTFLIFEAVDVETNLRSFVWSMVFARNIQQIKDSRDYWQQGKAHDRSVLLHAWSLGVEIQYYLVAPFIYALVRQVKTRTVRIVSYAGLSTVSFFFYLSADGAARFNSPLCRCWQFLLGSIAAEMAGGSYSAKNKATEKKYALLNDTERDNDKEALLEQPPDVEVVNSVMAYSKPVSQSLRTCLVVILVVYLASPFPFGERIGAIGVSLIVACLLASSDYEYHFMLSNRYLAYLGDISYALYLVHWPVIVFFGYKMETTHIDSWGSLITVIAITTFLTHLVHRTIEQWSLRTGYMSSAIYVGFMYTVLATLLLNSTRIEDMLMSQVFDNTTQVRIETTPGH